jgi:hypothetical protein
MRRASKDNTVFYDEQTESSPFPIRKGEFLFFVCSPDGAPRPPKHQRCEGGSEIRERRCGKKPALRFAPCGLRSLLPTDNSDGKTPIEPIDSAPAGVMVNKQDACGAIVRARGPSVSGRPRAAHFAARFTTSKKTKTRRG